MKIEKNLNETHDNNFENVNKILIKLKENIEIHNDYHRVRFQKPFPITNRTGS